MSIFPTFFSKILASDSLIILFLISNLINLSFQDLSKLYNKRHNDVAVHSFSSQYVVAINQRLVIMTLIFLTIKFIDSKLCRKVLIRILNYDWLVQWKGFSMGFSDPFRVRLTKADFYFQVLRSRTT